MTVHTMFVLYSIVTFSLEENIHCNKFTLPKLLPQFVFTGIIEIVGEESEFLQVFSGKTWPQEQFTKFNNRPIH